jgi:hypothetical protein
LAFGGGVRLGFFKKGSFFRSMAFSSNDALPNIGDFNSFSSNIDEEMFHRIHKQHQIVFIVTIASVDTFKLFNANEFKQSAVQLIDKNVSVYNVFTIMQATPSLFETLTNFSLLEFDELATLVIPTIQARIKSMGKACIVVG